jgi:hypothetical protein
MNAFVDGQNFVPYVQATNVVPRFLRLGSAINQTTDPANDPTGLIAAASARIRAGVPDRVSKVLKAVNIPELSAYGGPPVYLRNLTTGTLGDGHLAVYVDVATSPETSATPVTVVWGGTAPNGGPTLVAALVNLTAIPGVGPYNVVWTLMDATTNAVLYQSPAGGENYELPSNGTNPMVKLLNASQLAVSTDRCSGERSVGLRYTIAITRGGYTKTVSSGAGYWWAGTPPNPVPQDCYQPEPEPEPEPEPDPIPPMCRTKPWLCDDL